MENTVCLKNTVYVKDESPTTVGMVLDVLLTAGSVIVNGVTTYSVYKYMKDGKNVHGLCNYEEECGHIKYFISPAFSDLIDLFSGQEVEFIWE